MNEEESERKGDRPRVSVIGYGSLLLPNELLPFLDTRVACATPVRVEGFRRVFNQESVWRAEASEGDGSAVLNAVKDDDEYMNGVLIPDLTRREYSAIRERERGYHMVEVEGEKIEAYGGGETQVVSESDVVLVPTGDRVTERLLPVPEYIDICLDGARYWGKDFYEEFLRTTQVRPDETLEEYLN